VRRDITEYSHKLSRERQDRELGILRILEGGRLDADKTGT